MVPGKRVLPVRPQEAFDGRISQEFRTKDPEGGERGVSLLMGRDASTMATEVQCIVFDPKFLSDVQAARIKSSKAIHACRERSKSRLWDRPR